VASALVERVTAWATAERFIEISLEVGVQQEAARRLYEMVGFVTTARPFPYPPPQEHLLKLTMTRSL
jgi:ribosomal protein S18 acetylase RimI-like enzyme